MHPSQQSPKHSLERSAVTAGLTGRSAEALFDLVDPKNTGSHGFGLFQRFSQIFFRFADDTAHHGIDIHSKKRDPIPLDLKHFRSFRLSAAGNTAQKNTLGRHDPQLQFHFFRMFHKRSTFFDPILIVLHSC